MGSWKTWLHSIIAAAIGGAASAVLTPIAMPDTFNFTHAGLINIAKIAAIGAIVPVLTLLKQSPLPGTTADPAAGGVQAPSSAPVSIKPPQP